MRIAHSEISADCVLEHGKDQPCLAVEKRAAANQVVELNRYHEVRLKSRNVLRAGTVEVCEVSGCGLQGLRSSFSPFVNRFLTG